MQAQRQWNDIFKVLKEIIINLETIPSENILQKLRQNRLFKQNLRKSVANRPAL